MECQIVTFFHCRRCLAELPDNTSPKEWCRINVGYTAQGGVQIWCARHDIPIITLIPKFPMFEEHHNGH